MKSELLKLKAAVEDLEKVTTQIKIKKADLDKELEPKVKVKEDIEALIVKLKEEIKILALVEYKVSGKKTLLGGVKVQIKNIKSILYSKEKALKWAKEKDMFLMYDKKAFENAAESLHLDFVEIKTSTEEKVTFPKVIELGE